MKTHDLSRAIRSLVDQSQFNGSPDLRVALSGLANVLSEGPNLPLDEIRTAKLVDEVAVGLRALVSLSTYTKQQWLALAKDYGMEIELNPRDSARDVLGKVLRYLDAHPDAVKALRTRKKRSKLDTSELENALTKLLDRNDA